MIAGLKELDAGLVDAVDESMLGGDSAGPAAGYGVFERFRFADTLERIAKNRVHQFQNT